MTETPDALEEMKALVATCSHRGKIRLSLERDVDEIGNAAIAAWEKEREQMDSHLDFQEKYAALRAEVEDVVKEMGLSPWHLDWEPARTWAARLRKALNV